jgi:hypothetical protein
MTLVPLLNGAFDFSTFNFQVPTSGLVDCASVTTPTIATSTAAANDCFIVTGSTFLNTVAGVRVCAAGVQKASGLI